MPIYKYSKSMKTKRLYDPEKEKKYPSKITVNELKKLVSEGKLIQVKESLNRGYESRKGTGTVVPYNGKYGIGYKWYVPNYDSTYYVIVRYLILTPKGKQTISLKPKSYI